MFEFVVGLLASPFIAYVVYVYAVTGSRVTKTALKDKHKSFGQKALSTLLATLIAIVPLVLIFPLLKHAAIISGLIVGCFFVFLLTRKPKSPDE